MFVHQNFGQRSSRVSRKPVVPGHRYGVMFVMKRIENKYTGVTLNGNISELFTNRQAKKWVMIYSSIKMENSMQSEIFT